MKNKKISCIANSSLQTKKMGAFLAKEILKSKPGEGALILALRGRLGAGKTSFVQGLAAGFSVKGPVNSPTFVLIKEYDLPQNRRGFKKFYHIDCYRLARSRDLEDLGIANILKDPQNIVVIEWPEIARTTLAKGVLVLHFEVIGRNKRRITLTISSNLKSQNPKPQRKT
jgi:tRNA threonylcarbamoyladenosine biosynthesis protein TsaE